MRTFVWVSLFALIVETIGCAVIVLKQETVQKPPSTYVIQFVLNVAFAAWCVVLLST